MHNLRSLNVVFLFPGICLMMNCNNISLGQASLSLTPLKPTSADSPLPGVPSGMQSLAPPPARIVSSAATTPKTDAPIELKAIPKQTPVAGQTVTTFRDRESPIAVSPLKPVSNGDYPKSLNSPLSVERMIGPATDPSNLFSRTNIQPSFSEASEMLPPMRRQMGIHGELEWGPERYCWQSPAFCYSPLYFEQPNLERYGQGKGQPFASTVSAAYFVGQVTTLPIAVLCNPPWRKECTLGHHRPGNCAPIQRKPEHSR
jgi:hypothetical protein